MSRRSQSFAEGVQKFSWRVEKVTIDGQDRVKATCKNFPSISAVAITEQGAIGAAQRLMTEAAERAEVGTVLKGPSST